MKIPLSWLREYAPVDPAVDASDVAAGDDRLPLQSAFGSEHLAGPFDIDGRLAINKHRPIGNNSQAHDDALLRIDRWIDRLLDGVRFRLHAVERYAE